MENNTALVPYTYDGASGEVVKVTEAPAAPVTPADAGGYASNAITSRDVAVGASYSDSGRASGVLLDNFDINPAYVRALAARIPGARPTVETMTNRYGGPENAAHTLNLVSDLIANPAGGGAQNFLTALYDANADSFDYLARSVVNQYADFYQQPDQYERAQADERFWLEAANEGQRSIQWLSDQYEAAHWRELRKWRPFGADEESNERARYAALQGAFGELLAQPVYQQMHADAVHLLSNAPAMRWNGYPADAEADEARALELARDFNSALGQLIKRYISLYKGGGNASAPANKAPRWKLGADYNIYRADE